MKNDSVFSILPKHIQYILTSEKLNIDFLQEIRCRAEKPLLLIYKGQEYIPKIKYTVTKEDIRRILEYISHYSLYAYEHDMKQGFITIEGGHRVGMTGQVIIENGQVKNIRHISSLNIRISHEILGCADVVLPYIIDENSLYHTMIISPPRCGKTTLLRDLIRQISDGDYYRKGKTVGVVDERSEIGGCYKGIPQNQLGIRTDILDNCPKAEGMLMLIRSMGPEVIAVDEIGTAEDVHAVDYAMHCGCKMIATVHAKTLDELKNKPLLGRFMTEKRFERYILLGRGGTVQSIYNERGDTIYQVKNQKEAEVPGVDERCYA